MARLIITWTKHKMRIYIIIVKNHMKFHWNCWKPFFGLHAEISHAGPLWVKLPSKKLKYASFWVCFFYRFWSSSLFESIHIIFFQTFGYSKVSLLFGAHFTFYIFARQDFFFSFNLILKIVKPQGVYLGRHSKHNEK